MFSLLIQLSTVNYTIKLTANDTLQFGPISLQKKKTFGPIKVTSSSKNYIILCKCISKSHTFDLKCSQMQSQMQI
jgi:hypothetical protein